VTTERVGECEGVMYEEVLDHPSLASRRETNLTLEECLSVFSQSEELKGDNHWFCPSCNDFQPASRVLSVNSLPQTIIIHLKRCGHTLPLPTSLICVHIRIQCTCTV
jgi:ubiquitin C-terminal hydrolase